MHPPLPPLLPAISASVPALLAQTIRGLLHHARLLNPRPLRRGRSFLRTAPALALTALGTLNACGGGSDTPVTPVVITPGFTLTLSAPTLTVSVGSSASVSATISRTGTAGTVSLSAEGLAAGLTASFDPAEIASTTSTASLTLRAAASVVPGTYTFSVRARSAGITDQVIPTTVTVRALPAFTLTINPASASVQAGASTQATIQLARTEFTESVALSISGLPVGATATLGATSITTESTTLAITTTAATTPGVYPLTLQATSTLAPRTAAITLTVTAAQDFSIGAATAISVRQGTITSASTVTVTRSGGFIGAVNLTFEGLPAGITATPSSIAVSGASAQFTLSAAANAAVGLAAVTIRAKATGIADRVATVALTVTADPGSFTLAASAISATVQGQSSTSTLLIVRAAPFTGAVALSVSGLPPASPPRLRPLQSQAVQRHPR